MPFLRERKSTTGLCKHKTESTVNLFLKYFLNLFYTYVCVCVCVRVRVCVRVWLE